MFFFIFYKSVRGAPAHFWPYCIFLVFGLLVPNIYDNLLVWICQKVGSPSGDDSVEIAIPLGILCPVTGG